MHLLNILLVLCSAISLVLTKPYGYSYYVSLPGHYQSLEVKDGAVILNGSPQFPGNSVSVPGFRQGRLDPAFNLIPGLDGRYPVNPGIQANPGYQGNPGIQGNPNFRPSGLNPGIIQNPGFDGRFPITPENQFGPNYRRTGPNPNFNQYPGLGRRYPNQNEPDYRQGRDPDNEEIPDSEVDPQLVPNRPYPWGGNRPDLGNRGFNPNGELDPQFNRGLNSPEFGNRVQPLIPRRRGISRRTAKPQEIDESDKADREEVTTPKPCLFCGVNKINPMDGIDGNNVNPDSEPVQPKNVPGTAYPGRGVQNAVGTPSSVDVPGYLFNSPFVTYYVVP